MSLYARMKAVVDAETSQVSLAHTRRGRGYSDPSHSPADPESVEIAQVTTGTPLLESAPLSTRKPQVTVGTPCRHVTDPHLADWYAENPKLTCARCWLERGR
jgi:hypothetical protein